MTRHFSDFLISVRVIARSGLGQSKAAEAPAPVGQLAPAVFLRQVCEGLNTGPVVIISPSLSGMYSLPFLFQHSEQVKAYIPVAPICTEKFSAEQYSSIQVREEGGQQMFDQSIYLSIYLIVPLHNHLIFLFLFRFNTT